MGMRWATGLMLALMVLTWPGHAWGQQTQRQYLSGHDKDDAVTWQFFCTAGRNAQKWTTIPVPSNWELQGFGVFSYGVQVGKNAVPVQGQYKHTFAVPADWATRHTYLVFEGSMTDTQARINGQSAGPMHQGGYYRFRYDVTKLLKFGQKNLLEVTVDDESANTAVNRAERRGDYWNYGGIFRPVYLESFPAEFIDRVAINAAADGHFAMDVMGHDLAAADRVEAQILDMDGHAVGAAFSTTIAATKPTVALQTQIPTPRLWTAETPNLYQVEVRLNQGATTVHQIRQRFGFRTVEVRPGAGLYVNGQRVWLKGCCRHVFWPDSGRCVSAKISRGDIALLQGMNMNAVRMSHYPPDQHFLEACDELGLYVLDELSGWQHAHDTPVGRKLVEEMVTRDVNHPCILFWDNGNEGGFNFDLDGDYARWDPQQRHVLHPWAKFQGMNDQHYPKYDGVISGCSGDLTYMPTEMIHGLFDGGAGAGLEDYWNVMWPSKASAGGFIWAFLDEAVKRVDQDGQLDGRGSLAPDGIVGPYREKEGSYFAIQEIWSPIVIGPRVLPQDFTGTLTVENRYSFTEARQCGFTWQLRKFPRPGDAATGFAVLAEGAGKLTGAVPPGGKGALQLDLPPDWQKAEALALRVTDPAGKELWTWVWPVGGLGNYRAVAAAPGNQQVTAAESADAITLRSGDLTVVIGKPAGLLQAVTRGGQAFSLANGPRVAVGTAVPQSIEHRTEGGDAVVHVTYGGNLQAVTWRLHPNGWLQLDYSYTAEGPQDFYGVSFNYPEANVRQMKWLGNGPYRAWKNRLPGGTLSVWENQYNDTITGHTLWKYPEFKGYYAGVRWLQLGTSEGPITALLGQDDLYVQVLTPKYPAVKEAKNVSPAFPAGDISFLHAIPPIGSKFMGADKQGPAGQKALAKGTYNGSVSFFFGTP